jgi:hypothetical protein
MFYTTVHSLMMVQLGPKQLEGCVLKHYFNAHYYVFLFTLQQMNHNARN